MSPDTPNNPNPKGNTPVEIKNPKGNEDVRVRADQELDELFNKTINAKKIAVNTVIRTQDVAYNDEVVTASNELLERFREEFKATIKSHADSQALALLGRIENDLPSASAIYGVSDFIRGRESYRDQVVGHIEAERKRL